jgi:hypothetical protein
MPASFLVHGFPPWETIIGYRSSKTKKRTSKINQEEKEKINTSGRLLRRLTRSTSLLEKMVGFLGGDINDQLLSMDCSCSVISNPFLYYFCRLRVSKTNSHYIWCYRFISSDLDMESVAHSSQLKE